MRGHYLKRLLNDHESFLASLFQLAPGIDRRISVYVEKVWKQFHAIIQHLHEYELTIATVDFQRLIDKWCELLLGSRLPKASDDTFGEYSFACPSRTDCKHAEAVFGARFFVPYMHILQAHMVTYFSLLGSLRIGECQRGENENSAVRRSVKNTNNKRDEKMLSAVLAARLTTNIMPETEQHCPLTESRFVCDICERHCGNNGALIMHKSSHFSSVGPASSVLDQKAWITATHKLEASDPMLYDFDRVEEVKEHDSPAKDSNIEVEEGTVELLDDVGFQVEGLQVEA
jgi:hypothetical protein